MKTKNILILAFAVLICSAPAFAQRATRITFKRGAASATVSGTMSGYKSSRTYVIRVREGQTLTTEATGIRHLTIAVEPPPGSTYEQDMAADCHDRNEVTPTVAGDYKITVVECLKADPFKGRFTFKVTVR